MQVKPWDDETDLKAMEEAVRTIAMDGLVWGTSKLVPVGYGIKKLQITCVVEDDKVGTDDLEEKITAFEDYVSYQAYVMEVNYACCLLAKNNFNLITRKICNKCMKLIKASHCFCFHMCRFRVWMWWPSISYRITLDVVCFSLQMKTSCSTLWQIML